MSTNIYNGYLIKNATDSHELIHLCKNFRDLLEPLLKNSIIKRISEVTYDIIDRSDFGLPLHTDVEIKNNEIRYLFYDVKEFVSKKHRHSYTTGVRDVDNDFSCSICILPLEDKTLATFYSEKEEFLNLWESMDYVEPYRYQNSSDKPSNIKKTDWKKRESDWEKALPDGIPARNGFSFEPFIDPPFYFITSEEVANFTYDKNKRARKILKELMWIDYRENKIPIEDKNKISSYFEFTNYYMSEEGQSEINDKLPSIIEKLRDLTVNILDSKFIYNKNIISYD